MSKYDTTLPHWDLSPLFTSLDSPEFTAAFAKLAALVGELTALFAAQKIAAEVEGSLTTEQVARYESATAALENLQLDLRPVRAYLGLRVSTDSRDAAAQAKLSELRRTLVPLVLPTVR